MAWRTGTWQDQPCRRISFQVPSTVYPTWNSLPISVLILPSTPLPHAKYENTRRLTIEATIKL